MRGAGLGHYTSIARCVTSPPLTDGHSPIPRYSLGVRSLQVLREEKMRGAGLEPASLAAHAPQTCAYTNSATRAHTVYCEIYFIKFTTQ